MERTHRLKDDQAWLPSSVRHTRALVSGGIWATTIGAFGTVLAIAPGTLGVLWKAFAAGGAGAAVAGDRIGRRMMRRKLRGMARGEIELAALDARADGELVVVEGTIEAEDTLRGVLVDAEGVYRRLVFDPKGAKYVHEAAVDFRLVDDRGAHILVQAAGARWLMAERETVTYPRARFETEHAPAAVRALLRRPEVEAFERVLAVGTRVQIVGYKTASADVSGRVIDYRLPPQRTTLRSGPELPLVITTLDDLRD